MKKVITIITTMVIAMSKLISQTTLTAEESNPNKMGWMQGFPPPKDRIISAADGSFFDFPALRYSVNHMREFFPTRNVPSAKKIIIHSKKKSTTTLTKSHLFLGMIQIQWPGKNL